MSEKIWWSSSSGRIELEITLEQAEGASHQGDCEDDVLALMREPAIARQLDAIDPALLSAELKEWGAWDELERADHDANKMRLLWLACGDITEGNI